MQEQKAIEPELRQSQRKGNTKMKKPIAFFDLDGTLRDTFQFTYPRAHQVTLFPGVPERLAAIRDRGYYLVGITNQGGVAQKIISREEVEKANERTQDLLQESRLDLILYCPHYGKADGFICDCKKPAVGMVLDALASLDSSTLERSFVVGDSSTADQPLAEALNLPFIFAKDFRMWSVDQTLHATRRKPNHDPSITEDRATGCLVGLAVADALGAQVEFWSRLKVRQTYPDGLVEMRSSNLWKAGEFTDDTEMALLLADSLLDHQGLNARDVGKRFAEWTHGAKDVGIQIRRVTSMSGYHDNPEDCARHDYRHHQDNAAGNGAVMRCAPVAIFHTDSVSMLLADSRRNARITHGDPKAQSSCVLVNMAVLHLLRGGDKDAPWQHGMKFLTPREKECWKRLPQLGSLQEKEIASGGYTVHTVEAAFWSFVHSNSFEEAVDRAACLGGDADTVAAVTGALAGAHYGYSSIPQRWLEKLIDQERIRKTAMCLYHAGHEIH